MNTEIDLVDTTCFSSLIWRASVSVWPKLTAHRRPMLGITFLISLESLLRRRSFSMPRNLVNTSHVPYHEHRAKLLSAILVLPPQGDRCQGGSH